MKQVGLAQSGQVSARRHVTERCLIVADVDKTILAQTTTERTQFLRQVAPLLLEAAEIGIKLTLVTGNSISQLTNRFLMWLLEQLCHSDDLALLEQFHFFCNSGGVYFHFPNEDEAIASLLATDTSDQRGLSQNVFEMLTQEDAEGARVVHPRFVDGAYITRTQIPNDEASEIKAILEFCAKEYRNHVTRRRARYSKTYDLEKVSKDARLVHPFVDMRPVMYGPESDQLLATVQLTLKPILSFRHGLTEKEQARLFEKDLRTWLILRIQDRLDAHGLGHYVARPGGRSSIDVTLEKLDKAYAMEFLIDHLNLQGHARQGRRFGSNAIYFGDEVIVGGGNDYPVTRIPGLLVFAVNPDKRLVPFLSHVFVPSSILQGPDATADVLAELNKIARTLLKERELQRTGGFAGVPYGSAIDSLKIKVFGDRIRDKIDALKTNKTVNPEDWQILHAFVTLMYREDPAARQWLSILVDELDAIMTQIAENPQASQPAIGTSHPDY